MLITGMSIAGKISVGVRMNTMGVIKMMINANTMNVYGRLRASLTIHIMFRPSRSLDAHREPVCGLGLRGSAFYDFAALALLNIGVVMERYFPDTPIIPSKAQTCDGFKGWRGSERRSVGFIDQCRNLFRGNCCRTVAAA